jgi:hypothetical protein
MKKTYIAPATRVKSVNEQTSMLAASNNGLIQSGDNFKQSDITDNGGFMPKGSDALSKPNMFWEDDNENQ